MYWPGVTVDTFYLFTHSLVVLFRLTTHEESGWDRGEFCRRADVFDILDLVCEKMDRVPVELEVIDADGPRSGLFFKTTYLLRAIKSPFAAGMGPAAAETVVQRPNFSRGEVTAENLGDYTVVDDSGFNLSNEPWWLTDLMNMGSSWNF